MKSIRSYLTYSLVFSIGVAVAISIGLSYNRITHETEELYDAELAQIARVLEAILKIEFKFTGIQISDTVTDKPELIIAPDIISEEEYDKSGHKYEKKLAFQVWSRKGVPILSSNAQNKLLSFSDQAGFNYESVNGNRWRTFVLYSDYLSVWIKVSQLVEIREELTHEIASVNTSFLLISLPIIFLLITLIVRKGLAPLEEINQQISIRNNANLTPLSFSKVPNELQQVVDSVNRLMVSLKLAMERQKRFTGNAAHELRTPLAAIKVHAQNIYPETERLTKIQDHIVSGIDKLTHLFNQLITLSQAESDEGVRQKEVIQLSILFDELLAELRPILLEKEIELQAQINPNIYVHANRDALSILLRNLLDNAAKYVLQQGQVLIAAQCIEGQVNISISDNGPGLTSEQKLHAFERFYRGSSQDKYGCGIGLSIVQEICDACDFQITLLDSNIAETGLTVTLSGLEGELK